MVGPGLGRSDWVRASFFALLKSFKKKTVTLDADALWLLQAQADSKSTFAETLRELDQNNTVILTPNEIESTRLLTRFVDEATTPASVNQVTAAIAGSLEEPLVVMAKAQALEKFPQLAGFYRLLDGLGDTHLLLKGQVDIVLSGESVGFVKNESAKKRCGGQGDILAGLVSLYACWSHSRDGAPFRGMLLGSFVTRECSRAAFEQVGLSLTTSRIVAVMPGLLQGLLDFDC